MYDLRQLRNLKASKPGRIAELIESTHYGKFGSAHNIVANEDTCFVYSVGSRTCDSELHMIDVSDPLNPKFADCFGHFGEDEYVHDAECVIYNGLAGHKSRRYKIHAYHIAL